MHRIIGSFPITNIQKFKEALLEWSRPYGQIVWLDSNGHEDDDSSFEAILAISGQVERCPFRSKDIDDVQNFVDEEQDWLFGFITYDFKNQLEDLKSGNKDELGFPEMHFFQPEKIVRIKEGNIEFLYLEPFADQIEKDFSEIAHTMFPIGTKKIWAKEIHMQMRISKDAYFEKANSFLAHIKRGNIYEANFCQEFYSTNGQIDPWSVYRGLNEISEPPFATFLRMDAKYLMCASPERYLRKNGQTIMSQPIKGTAPRHPNGARDLELKKMLEQDPKERTENVMIADLIRNDLAKSASKGTVQIKELCKVHSFKQVHQMISTVVSKIPATTKATEVIKQTFPMGSMTGVPKISAMKLIEDLEETKRGLYSGTVGYFDPMGNFDFNVVIRSILYNSANQYISYSVGSAITARSDLEKEYQECLLKAKAMRTILEAQRG